MIDSISCPICGQNLPELEGHRAPADCVFYLQHTVDNLKNELAESKKQVDNWLSIANLLAEKLGENS